MYNPFTINGEYKELQEMNDAVTDIMINLTDSYLQVLTHNHLLAVEINRLKEVLKSRDEEIVQLKQDVWYLISEKEEGGK